MKHVNIAIVGALGAVGREMLSVLETSDIPIGKIIPLDVKEKKGTRITFRGQSYPVAEAAEGAFTEADIALFSAGNEASRILAPIAVREGAVVIDNSSCWRMDPQVPLVIPEVNPHALDNHNGIIANPNCSTIQMLVALAPIHRAYTIKRIVVSTYQAVSGSGIPAIEELKRQSLSYVQGDLKAASVCTVYPHRIAFNALPHIDVFEPGGYTKEEMKMVHETHKILDPAIQVSPTAVRIPVFRGHSEAVNIETAKPLKLEDVVKLLSGAPGVIVRDDYAENVYPLASEAEGENAVFVGRLRVDETLTHGLNMWIAADNLRKGAALNAVQIASHMIERALLHTK